MQLHAYWRKIVISTVLNCSDVKRGQNLETKAEAEAEAWATRPRPRPELQAEAEANYWRLRTRLRPKIIMKKYQIMINNIRFKIIAGKVNRIPEFYTIFARKMPAIT